MVEQFEALGILPLNLAWRLHQGANETRGIPGQPKPHLGVAAL